ncbi:MAG: glycosyltransferase family 4 protein [Candidatus Hodarchaeota archaeon]
MSKLKILYLSHASAISGAENCLLTLVKSLDKDRFKPVVVLPSEGPLLKELKKLGIKTHISPLELWIRAKGAGYRRKSNISTTVQGIMQIIELEKPDIVHTNTSVVLEGAIAAKQKNIPHIWHIHEILEGHPGLKSILPLPLIYWLMDLLSNKLVVDSNAVKSPLLSVINSEKMLTIYNGIDMEMVNSKKATNERESIRKELSIPSHSTLTVTVGSIVKEKGYEILLKAASLAIMKEKNLRFLIVGRGTPRMVRELRKNITRLKLNKIVYYLGYREDAFQIVKDADFFVLPSLTDASPLTILEAMALGKPVIATKSGGAVEIIDDGKSGFIIPIKNPSELCKRILELAKDTDQIKRMGKNALKVFEERFTAVIFAKNFENLYIEISKLRKSAELLKREKIFLDSFVEHWENYVELTYDANLLRNILNPPYLIHQFKKWLNR